MVENVVENVSVKGLSRFSHKPNKWNILETLKLLYDFYVPIPDDVENVIDKVGTYSRLIAWRQEFVLENTPKNLSDKRLKEIKKRNVKIIKRFIKENDCVVSERYTFEY